MPTRYPNGLTTASKGTTLGELISLDPTQLHVFFDDFDRYVAADWTITTTEAGTGAATEALQDEDGGVLKITNDNADNDLDFLQKVGESFLMATGKKAFFKARFKILEVIECDAHIGLNITDTTMLDSTDGIIFRTNDGDAYLDFHVEKDNVSSDALAIHTLVADTYLTVGFYYNGVDAVEYFVNDVKKGTLAVTNLPDDEALTVSFGIQNGQAVINSMSIDYIFVAKER